MLINDGQNKNIVFQNQSQGIKLSEGDELTNNPLNTSSSNKYGKNIKSQNGGPHN